ncbi:ATP-binding protein [Pseudonocardia sp. NPDC046786]|uniref:ATP-binding protein n=1 Tax=Pseudonocardia sp. NPDC046786 TaxID=3155471 RepID=UPI0033D55411
MFRTSPAEEAATTRFLDRRGRRYAVSARAVVGILAAGLAPFAGPPAGAWLCGAVAVAFAGWNLLHLHWARTGRPAGVGRADPAVVALLALAQPWLVDPGLVALQLGWVAVVVSFTAITVQWYRPPLAGALTAVLLAGAYLAGCLLSGLGPGEALLAGGGAWMLVGAALSRLLRVLVVRAGQDADALLADRFATERAAATEAARRAEQRRHWAAVHDTAAGTLLMVGLGEVGGREPWLRGQVDRDIATLEGRSADPAPSLARTVARSRVRVRPEPVPAYPGLPGPALAALDGAVGEALENVRRHAGTGAARLRLHPRDGGVRIEITDDGGGFDPASVPRGRTGLRTSVAGRMAGAGGRATVVSAAGRGTTVTLDWPAPDRPAPDGPERPGGSGRPGAADPGVPALRLLRGLRLAQSLVVLVVLVVFCLGNLLATAELYPAPWAAWIWFAGIAAVALADLALVTADRYWGAVRLPAAAFVLLMALGATLSLPADGLVRPAHWTLGVTGFLGVLLFCDRRLRWTVGFIVTHVVLMAGVLVLRGRADPATLVEFGIVVVGVEGLHLAVALGAVALRTVAAETTAAAAARAAAVTREEIAQRVHGDRERRYAALRAGVLPLLRGLRDGSLAPGDPDVRRRAAVESARMRRLFAAGDDGGELAGELEALVERAERRGLVVRFAAAAPGPEPPAQVRRTLVGHVGAMLAAATGTARVALHADDGGLVLAVVAELGAGRGPRPVPGDGSGIRTEILEHEGRTWLEVRWQQRSPR